LPQVIYRFTENLSATVGANFFFGRQQLVDSAVSELRAGTNRTGAHAYKDPVENGLSPLRDRDEIYMTLRYTFCAALRRAGRRRVGRQLGLRDVGLVDASGQGAEEGHDRGDLLVAELLAELVPGHQPHRLGQGRDRAVVEVRPGLLDVAQRRDLEEVLVGLVLRGLVAAEVLGLVGMDQAELLVQHPAERGAHVA